MPDRAAELLALVRDELVARAPAEAGDALVVGTRLLVGGGRLTVTVEARGVADTQVHAHVIASLVGRGAGKFDACIAGYGATTSEALGQAAAIWLSAAGAPILSLIAARPLFDADHFDGSEPWGVPGAHGFVGPVLTRGASGRELAGLNVARAFSTGVVLDGAAPVLAKATLLGRDGRWQRTLELDGHRARQVDEDWPLGVEAPVEPIVCVRFAVAFRV